MQLSVMAAVFKQINLFRNQLVINYGKIIISIICIFFKTIKSGILNNQFESLEFKCRLE